MQLNCKCLVNGVIITTFTHCSFAIVYKRSLRFIQIGSKAKSNSLIALHSLIAYELWYKFDNGL